MNINIDLKKYSSIAVENENTNYAFRIAYLMHVLGGCNDLERLSRYSEHIDGFTDDGKSLRGAYGPRMRNWIGAHQLQDMINTNADITDPEEYIKPAGVDQCMAVFDDLKSDFSETTIVIRDPGIDFEVTEDIPDLISITFIPKNKSLNVYATYGTAWNKNFLNEVSMLMHLCRMYDKLLNKYEECVLHINSYSDNEDGVCEFTFVPQFEVSICDTPKTFWRDLETLQKFSNHIRFYLNEKTFDNPDVAELTCADALNGALIEEIESPYFKNMAYALMIWAFVKYGSSCPYRDEEVTEFFTGMGKSDIKYEVALALNAESQHYLLTDEIKEVLAWME